MTSTQARDYAVDLKSLHQYLREEMANTQLHYQGPADAKRTLAPDFKVGASICEGQILPVNTTIQKAIREEPGTLHYHRTSRLPFFYTPPSRLHARRSPCLPCLPT